MSKRDRTFVGCGGPLGGSCPYCARYEEYGHDESCPVADLRAEAADLKARLKAIRDATRFHEHGDGLLEHHERVIKYATNIRRKNWVDQ